MAKTPHSARPSAGLGKLKSGNALTAGAPVRAQHDTQVPVSGDIAEIEAIEAGMAAAHEAQLETPDAPKPRSAKRTEGKAQKEAEKRQRAEQKRRERSSSRRNRNRRRPNASAAA